MINFKLILKTSEASNVYRNLNNQAFISNEINTIKIYFIDEIKETELMSKRFGKCTAFLTLPINL